MAEIVLKNIFFLQPSYEREGIFHTDILIEENRIKKIGKDLHYSSEQPPEILDCSNHVVIPGLVNTHHHFYQTLTRNVPAVQSAKLFDWLVYLYEIWKHIDEEAVYYSSLLAIAELLKTGCTCTTDHHYLYPKGFHRDLMELQFHAAAELGIRFSPTRGSMSLSKKDGGLPPDSVVQTDEEILKDSERVIRQYHDSCETAMRKIILAPCSPFSVTEKLMKDSASLARNYGVRLHTHLAETSDENDFCVKVYGRRPLKLMEDVDFLGDDVSFAHGIFFNDDELNVLSETGTHIAHCPSSNMRLGSGICRVVEMLPKGIQVGLAVDGSASNDTSDMLGEMRQALLLQRVAYGAEAISPLDVLMMATENGAKLLGFPKCGRIEEGRCADLAIFNVHKIGYAGALSDPFGALLLAGFDHNADYTIVNGEFAVKEGALQGFPEEKLIIKANDISRRLFSS